MNKSQKELAFLRNLYVETDWTQRFTDLFDENFKFTDEENFLYFNIGGANHALVLREKLDPNAKFSVMAENRELSSISKAKAESVKANIKFLDDLPTGKFDAVLADASFVKPADLENFLAKIIKLSNGNVMFFLPTASSFGDVFSFLWETFLNAELLEYGTEVERLITEIPTVSKVEEMSENLGLTNINSETKNEFFEFESGEDFVNSPLVADFLLPVWLDFFDEKQLEKLKKKIIETIDNDRGDLSFRFAVKMTLVSGEKIK